MNEDEQEEPGEGSEDEWEQVGPRNKTSVTRQAEFVQTPITGIFGGHIRFMLFWNTLVFAFSGFWRFAEGGRYKTCLRNFGLDGLPLRLSARSVPGLPCASPAQCLHCSRPARHLSTGRWPPGPGGHSDSCSLTPSALHSLRPAAHC